jgi:hypothetical protein
VYKNWRLLPDVGTGDIERKVFGGFLLGHALSHERLDHCLDVVRSDVGGPTPLGDADKAIVETIGKQHALKLFFEFWSH